MDKSPGGQPQEGQTKPKRPAGGGRPRNPFLAALAVTGLLAFVVLAFLAYTGICNWHYLCGPLLAEDIAQGRLDVALPAPQGSFHVEQSFTPRRDGLAEVEIILVRYGGEFEPGQDEGRFTLELRDDNGRLVAAESLSTQALAHNQVYTLSFPPETTSAGRAYTLALLGNQHNHVSAWAYSIDVYDNGALRLLDETAAAPEMTAAELRFITRYSLGPSETLRAAAAPLRQLPLLLTALLFLPLPGALLLALFRPRGWDAAARVGAALALGVAAWPLIWHWTTLLGARWSAAALWAVVAVGWGLLLLLRLRSRFGLRAAAPVSRGPLLATHALLAGVLLLALASRFVAARDLAFPPWVDSSRHALITAVMVERGQTLTDYVPYLPVDRFPYHFGFHTLSAALLLMTGAPLPGLLLFLMQLLGGLLPLPVYTAGWMVTRRRSVGLLAAFLVALPFFFPGYYATWGRMTQLAAMVVMPVLMALTWRMGRGWSRYWPLVGIMAAGVFLLHFRVFLFYLPFAALALAAQLLGRRRAWPLLKAGALGAALAGPRLYELLSAAEPLSAFGRSLPGYNDFPTGYLTTGWERAYLALAAVAAPVVVVAAVALRRRWAAFPLLLLLWVAALFALLAGERLGLPESLVVNLNSMYITLFLPLALLLAIVAATAVGWARRRPAVSTIAGLAGGIALAALLLFGWRQQANILNPQTILALPEDTAALDWAAANLPPQARVAVSAWQWLGATWAGSDGGAWIVPLTGRESTTPPVDHIYNVDLFAQVRAFNEYASAVEDWSDPAAAAWLAEQGVTHVFVGRRGGFLDPAELSRNPALETVFRRDGTFIFALK